MPELDRDGDGRSPLIDEQGEAPVGWPLVQSHRVSRGVETTVTESFDVGHRGSAGPNRSQYVRRKLERLIRKGILQAGEQLPAERDLCSFYQVSRGTLRAALSWMQSDGLVKIRHGMPTLVTGQPARPFERVGLDADASASRLATTRSAVLALDRDALVQMERCVQAHRRLIDLLRTVGPAADQRGNLMLMAECSEALALCLPQVLCQDLQALSDDWPLRIGPSGPEAQNVREKIETLRYIATTADGLPVAAFALSATTFLLSTSICLGGLSADESA